MKKAVVLLSGGLDSATVLAIALSERYAAHALTIRYGQRHVFELEAARLVAQQLRVERHITAEIDLSLFGGSALTGNADVPHGRSAVEMGNGIPVTYVPARNTIFLSLALGWAEAMGSHDIFIGVNAIDYSGYPDCRPEFIKSFEVTANLGTRTGVEGQLIRIHVPLIHLTKSQIIQRGIMLGVDYGLTATCYDPSQAGLACGTCDACQLRLKGFAEAGLQDPIAYQ